jgi:hypothetical protein
VTGTSIFTRNGFWTPRTSPGTRRRLAALKCNEGLLANTNPWQYTAGIVERLPL